MASGVVLNCLSNDYGNGRFKCMLMNTIPSTWSDITSSVAKTPMTSIQNDGAPFSFDSNSNYLAIVVEPTSTDLTGSTIIYDIAKLLQYAPPTGSTTNTGYGDSTLLVKICESSDTGFVDYFTDSGVTTSTNINSGTSYSEYTFYTSLSKYSVTKIPDAVVGVIPFTLGAMDSGAKFAYQAGSDDVVKIIKPPRGLVVKISHTPFHMWWLLVIIILIIVFALVIVYVIRYYKKRKAGM